MKYVTLIVISIILCGCIQTDCPTPPTLLYDKTASNIEVLQVIDNDEILAYYNNSLGHFTIKDMKNDIVDGGIYYVKGVKQVGTYRYMSTFGVIKTIPDYSINNDMEYEKINKERLEAYNLNFPEEERKNYLPLFCGGALTVIFTPFAILSTPLCMFDKDCYFKLTCMSDEEAAIPYKDRK